MKWHKKLFNIMSKKFVHFKIPANIENAIKDYKTKDPDYWIQKGEEKAFELTNFTIENVPAYKKFLKESGCNIKKITSLKDFKSLPFTSKNDYLKKSVYKDLFPVGGLDLITTIASTSGSTGEPFYFPRGEEQDEQYEHIAEVFLKNQFEIDKKRTLVINGFGLGIWIGGIFTYKNINKLAQKGYRIAVAPAGTNKEIFIKALKNIAPLFDQVILAGYPPFIKDIIDEAREFGIEWKNYDIKIFTATESFSENFRDYLVSKTGIKNSLLYTLNIYGSVELGTMSHETALTNLIRKIVVKNKKVFNILFPDVKVLPTLAQYYPHIVNFEEVNGEVIATGYGSSIPLVRYKFSDYGGIFQFEELISILNKSGVDILNEAKKENINTKILKLPFVWVAERSDFVVIVRGANIYPGNIKNGLQVKELDNVVTGKFTMIKREDKKLSEYLEINVELKRNVKKSDKIKKLISKNIVKSLREENSEYNYLYSNEGASKLSPDIKLHAYETGEYFKPGLIKQKWVV